MNKLLLSLAIGSVLTVSSVASAQDQARADRLNAQALPASIQSLKLDSPVALGGIDAASLQRSPLSVDGSNQVLIRLTSPSVSEQKVRGKSAERAKAALKGEQSDLLAEVLALDPNAKVLGQTQMVLNAVFVEVDASVLAALAGNPAVQRIVPVGNYELDLSETVPYIGASAVQANGYDGSGVSVAVLDSGIDYYHAALGGDGNPADYAADDPTIIEPGTFPTAKVVGGYDFVGSVWPNGPLAPDPDPLDDGVAAGHGTHVAHIIGGNGGVAPGVDLYGVKVCSSVSTSCSGVALIQGMEFAVDPDGDGNPKDAINIVNMSLGANYGQPFDDDLSAAVDAATEFGVLTVSSAGNGSDKPYVTGTPSSAATALSVAQTQVPSAFVPFINVDGVDYLSVFQTWSTYPAGVINGPVQYGDGAGGNLNGCAPFAPGSLAGKVVLVDRGACFFSDKIANIEGGGGLAGIIGLVAPGDPFAGGCGSPCPFPGIPGYMISEADSLAIKAQIGNPGIATIDPNNGLPLVGSMVGSSSRGPQHESTTLIKPEIGAPGASVSAIAGTGTAEGPFGGTSGASPMVAGAAALLLGGFDTNNKGLGDGKANGLALSPLETKALLMNNGETNIDTDPFTGLAPITRIGGGEVRVDRAMEATVSAWEDGGAAGALSFGFVDVDGVVEITKTVRVHSYSNEWKTFDIIPTFRFADDEASGAVSVSAPASVTVKPGFGVDQYFDVTLTIDGSKLLGNYMNSGSQGANPAALTLNEFDGYLILDDGEHPIHLAWHVLPRKAAHVVPDSDTFAAGGFPSVIGLDNQGVGAAQNDAYALLATSPNKPEGDLGQQSPMPDLRAVGVNTFPVPAGFCSAEESFLWVFAINTWERQEHLVPVSHQVALDTNQDGTFDYVVLNRDVSFNNVTDGRQLSWVLNLSNGNAGAFFFAEHSMNTGNTVLIICGEQVGLTGTDMLATNVNMEVFAQDWYYGGPGDLIDGLTVTPLGEQYYGVPTDVPGETYDPTGLLIYDFGPFPGNTPEEGFMLITNGDRGTGNRGGATQDTEALLFTPE